MHGIKMPPFAAPDETVTLERLDYFTWPIPARKGFQLAWRHPAPIGRFLHIKVDGGGKGVIA